MNKKVIAIFDFDNTLVKGDSLWPFLVAAAGLPRTSLAFAKAIIKWPYIWLKKGDTRTYVKACVLKELLGNRSLTDLAQAIEKVCAWPKLKEPAISALRDHNTKGHLVVIASGGLDIYLPTILEKFPHDALICTQMEIVDGVVTGKMLSGNCVRLRKAELVKEFLTTQGPFEDSWGYGNAPHDLPMLEYVKHKVIV